MKNKIDKLRKKLTKIEKKVKKICDDNIFETDFSEFNSEFVKEYRLSHTKTINYAEDNETVIKETIQKCVIFELDSTDQNLVDFCKKNNIDDDTKVVVLNEKFIFTESHLKFLLKQLKHLNDEPVFEGDTMYKDFRKE